VVSYSVDQGCSLDSSRNNGNIDITIALKYKTSGLLKVFINHGAETQLRHYYAATNAAIVYNHLELLQILMDKEWSDNIRLYGAVPVAGGAFAAASTS